VPFASDVWNSCSTLSFTAGRIYFQTPIGRPSSPGAFHGQAANSFRSTSSIVSSGDGTGRCWCCIGSSSISCDSGGKKVFNSPSACSPFPWVVESSLRASGGITSNAGLPVARNRAACQIFASSCKNSCQWAFLCLRIAS
jgi:hypothetical protein